MNVEILKKKKIIKIDDPVTMLSQLQTISKFCRKARKRKKTFKNHVFTWNPNVEVEKSIRYDNHSKKRTKRVLNKSTANNHICLAKSVSRKEKFNFGKPLEFPKKGKRGLLGGKAKGNHLLQVIGIT